MLEKLHLNQVLNLMCETEVLFSDDISADYDVILFW